MKERHQEGSSLPFYHFPLVVFASQYPLTLTRNILYYLIEKIIYKSTLKMKELSKKNRLCSFSRSGLSTEFILGATPLPSSCFLPLILSPFYCSRLIFQ